MGIIDPSIIAVLQTYMQAQQDSRSNGLEPIGSVLGYSLKQSMMIAPTAV